MMNRFFIESNRWILWKSFRYLAFICFFGPLSLQSQIPATSSRVLSPVEPPVSSSLTSAYVLNPSDSIQISVFNEPDLSLTVRLNGDGTVMIPLIGRIALSGLTLQKAQDLITRKLGADYLVNPMVTVTVVSYTKKFFTVLGQVARPGPYEIPPEDKVTLLQAIGMGGGFTRIANTRHIIVKRVLGNKQYKIINVDATKLGEDIGTEELQIQAGDTITVPESWY